MWTWSISGILAKRGPPHPNPGLVAMYAARWYARMAGRGETGGRPQMTFSRFYLPQLDGLRFLAFASVFLAHGMWGTPRPWLARLQPVGNFGVDLFFVLSSYLLTTLLLREQAATGRIDVVAFWIRRGLRIWPLYLVCVAVIAAGTSLSWWYLLGMATFTFNWQVVVPFAGSLALLEAIGPLWSLS